MIIRKIVRDSIATSLKNFYAYISIYQSIKTKTNLARNDKRS